MRRRGRRITITSSPVSDFRHFDRPVLQKPTREVGEEKDQYKPTPAETDFPETPEAPLTTDHGKLQGISQAGISPCPRGVCALAKGTDTRSCVLDQMTTQSYHWLLSGSKAER